MFCFFQHASFLLQLLCFTQNTKSSVFRITQLSKTINKSHFFTHPKKRLFQKKGVIFAFGQFPLKPRFLWCFLVFRVLAPKHFGPKQIVRTTRHVFLPSYTNSGRQFLQKKNIHFFIFLHFWRTTLKTLFIYIILLFQFCFFSFLCFSVSNIKTKAKNAILYSKTSFLISRQFCENTILAQSDTNKHTIKIGENNGIETWTSFQLRAWTNF